MRLIHSVPVSCAAVLLAACTATNTPAVPSLDLVVPGQNTLRVLVTRSETGTPVAGAHVCASSTRGASDCADAGKDGTVALHGAPGTYFVRVSGPSEQRFAEAQRVTDLFSGDASVWVELTALQRISGTIRNEAGAKVAGAEACAHPANDDPQTCARSGTDGAYAIDVKAGIYRLDVTGPSGGRLVSQWARGRVFLEEADILDARRADVPDVDVTLVRGVVLSGTVRLAGAVVENAQVCIRTLSAPLPWQCERTDKNGRYAALREPGDYYVWVVPPANVRAVPQWYDRALTGVGSTPLTLSGDRTLDVALPNGIQIRGVLRTTDGEIVANALVCVDTPFTTGRICRETDGNGRYTITTRPETYLISVIPPAHSGLIGEYWAGKRTWKDADEISLSGPDVTLDLTVRRGVTITGTIKDTRGIPVAGATINFSDDRGVAAATDTDAAGRYEAVVLPGRFGVDVTPPFVGNLVGKTTSVDVRAAMDFAIVLEDVAP
jgi:hypothetical protein